MFLDLIHKTREQLAESLPFVIYRRPEKDEVTAIFQKDSDLHCVKNFLETGFVFAPFNSKAKSVLIPPDKAFTAKADTNKLIPTSIRPVFPEESGGKSFHIRLVSEGIAKIKKGVFDKIVLSRKLRLSCHFAPLDLFESLLSFYPTAFCYLWYHPRVGMWLGATPEILLCKEGSEIITTSLAGTQEYTEGVTPVWEEKELKEQELVTQYIVNAFKAHIDNLWVSELETVRAGDLLHLKTRITGIAKGEELQILLKKLHPTPAVCGLPMEAAKSFILDNEGYNREYYTGFLGELNYGDQQATRLFVNLRCMQLKDKKAIIYVGGGVTQDSIPEKEWQETVAKSATMLKLLFKSVE